MKTLSDIINANTGLGIGVDKPQTFETDPVAAIDNAPEEIEPNPESVPAEDNIPAVATDVIPTTAPVTNENIIVPELQKAYCEEIACAYKYFTLRPFLQGATNREDVEETFENHYKDELEDHAQKLQERLNQMNSGSTFNLSQVIELVKPEAINLPCSCLTHACTVIDAVQNLIIDEQDAIQHYRQIITIAKELADFTTEKIAKEILADEEEHLVALQDYLKDINL